MPNGETGLTDKFRKILTNGYSIIRNGKLIQFDERDLINGKYIVPSKVTEIGERAFVYCENLIEIEIPSSVRSIGNNAFFMCSNLKKISLSEGLEKIGRSAFRYCGIDYIPTDINKKINPEDYIDLKIPDSVKEIGEEAFGGVKILKTVKLPSQIKNLATCLFAGCTHLKEVVIPDSVEEVDSECFYNCVSLKEITFPQSVKYIENDVLYFDNTSMYESNLSRISIENKDVEINGVMDFGKSTKNLKSINISSSLAGNFPYKIMRAGKLNIDGKPFKSPDYLKFLSSEFYEFLTRNYSFEEILSIKFKPLNEVTKHILGENFNPESELKYYLQCACYHLGVLEGNQQAKGFLIDLYDKKILKKEMLMPFAEMRDKEVNKRFAKFYMENYKAIFKTLQETGQENINELLTTINTDYDELAKGFVANNSSARQKIPTLEFFINVIKENRFGKDIEEQYVPIAAEMGKFSSIYEKEDFERACKVYDKYVELVSKKTSPSKSVVTKCIEKSFSNIHAIENNINNDLKQAVSNLGKTITQEETWEWLEKTDARNFTLGLYCNCCARIGGAGEGIAVASILDPNVRNLLVKDSKGRPIAKGTLYINSDEGYALFNNFEVAHEVKEEKKQKVYALLKDATNSFIKSYNKEVSHKRLPPIKHVNVGMSNNDLENILRHNNKKSTKILKGLDFSRYVAHSYGGDWTDEQYEFINATKNGKEIEENGKSI